MNLSPKKVLKCDLQRWGGGLSSSMMFNMEFSKTETQSIASSHLSEHPSEPPTGPDSWASSPFHSRGRAASEQVSDRPCQAAAEWRGHTKPRAPASYPRSFPRTRWPSSGSEDHHVYRLPATIIMLHVHCAPRTWRCSSTFLCSLIQSSQHP